MSTVARRALLLAAAGLAIPALASPADADTAGRGRTPHDQVVLSGRLEVPRGEIVGQVLVLHGSASISGVARGDVVVVDGPIAVFGQVAGSVVAVDGRVFLGSGAQVGGDVSARGEIVTRPGAMVGGRIRRGVAYTWKTPLRLLGRFGGWLALSLSTLLLGGLLLLLAPRGADAVFDAVRTSPWSSLGWGLAIVVAFPFAIVLLLASLIGIPLGLVLLLASGLLVFVGYAWSSWTAGRLILRPPRNRLLAYLLGWSILSAAALVPFIGVTTWIAGTVFGLGTMAVAVWRSRRASHPPAPPSYSRIGKHREGRAAVLAPHGPEEFGI